MIRNQTAALPDSPRWQTLLARAVRDPQTLIHRLRLSPALLPAARRAATLFPLRVPEGYLARIRPGDPTDPLLRQVLPLEEEFQATPGFSRDPVGETTAMVPGGVIHKYHGRVLLVTTGACAVNCRYCFRRHFPYEESNASTENWRGALQYIAERPEIGEVILSGGDPLTLSDRRLEALVAALTEIPHVQRLRVHSRLPVVLPERVDERLLAWLTATRLRPVIVFHANHANEVDKTVATAARRLRDSGVTVLNQAVLLAGVNDSAPALISLSERLFEAGILPYYLHVLDKVEGAAHFDVPEDRARRIHAEAEARLPGYLLPRLVREDAGAGSKTRLA
jgi:EF-P beta-lysylation protein EpmB